MIKINITEEEKYLLKEYFKTSSIKLIRLKSQAILMRAREMKLKDISDLLFKDARIIERVKPIISGAITQARIQVLITGVFSGFLPEIFFKTLGST